MTTPHVLEPVDDAAATVDQVPSDYRHRPKLAIPQEPLEFGRTRLKWYEIRPSELDVTQDSRDRSRTYLRDEIDSGRLALGNELGFVVRHHCDDVIFLIISTWRGSNELWETVYAGEPDEEGRDYRLVQHGDHKATYCVWELGAVVHERDAWVRYLSSDRTEADRVAYMEDHFAGLV